MDKLRLSALASAIFIGLSGVAFAEKSDDKKWDVNAPQGEFIQADIKVNQGTWMNIDLSPDGKTLVFDLLGDIYSMPVSGGEATPLLKGIAWHMQPTFSPDGKQIAFTSDQGGGDNIWVMNADGSDPRAVTKETFRLLNSPAWSPDGNFIVARKHFTDSRSLGAGEVWMYHKSGGKGAMLTKRPNDQKDLGEPAFSPDGRYVYFSQDATPGKTFHYSKDSVQGIYKIKRLDRETGEIEVILSGLGGAIRPTPSPDGKFLAYIRRDDFQSTLYLYDLESGEHTKLYDKLERDMQETWAIHGVYPTMAWSKDGEKLVFWAKGKIHQLDVESKQAEEIPFSVATTKKIQQALRFEQDIDQDEFDVKMLRHAQVAPNGKKVVFEALGHLYTRNLNGGKPKRLTRQDDHFELFPSFSRDGKKLAYVTWDDDKQGSIRVVSARTGKGKTVLKGPGKFVEPSFSPDGKFLVYRKITGGYITSGLYDKEPGIYLLNLKTGDTQRISENGHTPQFGARSDRVYAMQSGDKKQKLLSIDLATHKQHTLYKSKLATEFKVSPDGKYLAFAERFKVFVTPLVERGSAIEIGPKDWQFPVKQLSKRAGEGISWSQNANQLYWTLGPELYTANLDGIFDIGNKHKPIEDNIDLGFKHKALKGEGLKAFVGARVVTMKGDEVIEDGVVLVEGNKIKAVGSKADVRIPENARVIQAEGKTILPGFIDAHAHGSQGNNEIIPQQNWINYAGLTFGVTTIHDPSNDTTEVFTASEMQKAGEIVGPRIFSTGTILYGARGAGYTSHVDSLDDAKFHLERLRKVGAFSVKSYNQPRRNQRQQVIQAGRELEMMVVPEGGSLLQHNLSMVADGHTTVEHALPVANIYDDVRQLWKASGTAYTPTLVVAYGGIWGENYWYDKTEVWKHPRLSQYVPEEVLQPRSMRRPKAPDHHYNHFNAAKVASELQADGVLVNIGAHGQREGLGAHWEVWMHVQGGSSALDALKTATINPAKSLGLDKQIGSLEVGKLADLMIIDGNPLQDIRVTDKVSQVMINGRLFDAQSMNEVGKEARSKFFFED